jgi:hypothetical protein
MSPREIATRRSARSPSVCVAVERSVRTWSFPSSCEEIVVYVGEV